jgi:hypothetical protein
MVQVQKLSLDLYFTFDLLTILPFQGRRSDIIHYFHITFSHLLSFLHYFLFTKIKDEYIARNIDLFPYF